MAEITLQLFTVDSLKKIEEQRAERKISSPSNIEDERPFRIPNPSLVDGQPIPKSFLEHFRVLKKEADDDGKLQYGVAFEEIDPFYENTFLVVGHEPSSSTMPTLTRFNVQGVGNAFSPLSPTRRFAVMILTHWIFRAVLVGVILVNFLLVNMTAFKKETELRIPTEVIFLLVYGFELIIKLAAKGFFGGPFTCASSFWCWLDFAVIIFGIAGLALPNPAFAAFSGIRLLKIVPLLPSLKRYWNFLSTILVTLLRRLLPLAAVLTFSFTLLSLQLYQGVLTAKCVLNYTVAHEGDYGTPESRRFFFNSSQNWLREDWKLDSEAVLCGVNAPCPKGYVCVHGFGSNPEDNYTNFDSFSWALLSIFRTITQDYLEALTQMIAKVIGQFSTIFFYIIFFVISLPFLSFTIAVVAKYFHEYDHDQEQEDNTGQGSSGKGKRDSNWWWNKLCFGYAFCWKPSDASQRSANSIVSRPIFEMFITTVLVLDVLTLSLDHYMMARTFGRCILYSLTVYKLVYIVEFGLKYTAAGGFGLYIAVEGNSLAFIVLPPMVIQLVYYFAMSELNPPYIGGIVNLLAFCRVFRIVYKWDSLRIIFKIVWSSILSYWIVFALLTMYWLIFAFVGQTMFGAGYRDTAIWGAKPGEGEFYAATLIPRWNFTDFWHSLAVVFRLLCGEWIETLWDCFTATTAATTGPNNNNPVTAQCYLYYLLAILLGNFLVVCGAIGVVLTTIKTLHLCKSNPRQRSNVELICHTICRPANGPDNSIQMQDYTNMHARRNLQNQNDITNEPSKPDPDSGEGCWAQCRNRVTKMRSTKLYHVLSVGLIVLTCLSFIPINVNDEKSGQYPKYSKIQTGLSAFFWYWLICVEVPLKFVQFGVKGFFSNFGNTFDLILALAKLINVAFRISGSGLAYFLTSLEFCRPFLLVDRLNRLRCVARGLYTQVRALTCFVLAGAFVWLIFGIQGIRMYAGYFYKCVTPYEGYQNFRHTQGVRINDCSPLKNFTWMRSEFNFDNIGESLQSLSWFSFFNGWISVLHDAVDSTEINQQPIHENNYSNMLPFLIFIIFGVFFLITIIIGVFVYLLEQEEARLQFLSTKQKRRYREKMDKLKESIPGTITNGESGSQEKAAVRVPESTQIGEPSWKFGKPFYAIVTNIIFERVVLGLIVVNAFLLACHSYGQHPVEESVLHYLELVVLILFTIEMVMKIMACGKHYFMTGWNIFDFILVILGIIVTVLRYSEVATVSSSTFFLFRLIRFYRILSWEDSAPKLQDLVQNYSKPRTPEAFHINALHEPKIIGQIYNFVTNFRFDAIIMLFILVDFFEIHFNVKYMSKVEQIFLVILIPIIYYLELILKLIAWRQFYFTSIWNVVDFVAIIGITLRRPCGIGWSGDCAYVVCDVLLVLESIRIFRLLRFIPIWSYGVWKKPEILLIWHTATLQMFKRSLIFALPTILNLLAFFVLLLFSFTFIGMILFGQVKLEGGLNEVTNFATFTNAFMTLIQVSSFSGVDGAYLGMANTVRCQMEWTEKGGAPNCGHPFYAKLFLIMYCGLSGLIFVNIYLALILETINQLSLGESPEGDSRGQDGVGAHSLVIRRPVSLRADSPIATIQYTTITTKTTTISKSAKNEEREFNITEVQEEIVSK